MGNFPQKELPISISEKSLSAKRQGYLYSPTFRERLFSETPIQHRESLCVGSGAKCPLRPGSTR
jgi:hypothetical protein